MILFVDHIIENQKMSIYKFNEKWFENEVLHRTAINGNIKEVDHLIRSGYPINVFDDLGFMPLHYAVEYEHYKIAEFLLNCGANVNAQHEESNSDTPIIIAARGDYPEMLSLLISFEADPNITSWMGLNAYHRANDNKNESGEKIRLILQKTLVKK